MEYINIGVGVERLKAKTGGSKNLSHNGCSGREEVCCSLLGEGGTKQINIKNVQNVDSYVIQQDHRLHSHT